MNHRKSDVRTAVGQRQRSQEHLRAVTATVGIGGVLTAGAVALILPGATHTAASASTASTPAAAPPASTGPVSSGPAATATTPKHRAHHHARRATKAAASAAPVSTPASTPAAPAPVPSSSPTHVVSGGS
jgi:hypothetical protein